MEKSSSHLSSVKSKELNLRVQTPAHLYSKSSISKKYDNDDFHSPSDKNEETNKNETIMELLTKLTNTQTEQEQRLQKQDQKLLDYQAYLKKIVQMLESEKKEVLED